MCHNRLGEGLAPACVSACPRRRDPDRDRQHRRMARRLCRSANAPGLPSADDSISTTRITLPANLRPDTRTRRYPASRTPGASASGRWSSCWCSRSSPSALSLLSGCCRSRRHAARLASAALASLGSPAISLGASTLHLGRPVHAWRALQDVATLVAEPGSAAASPVRGAASLMRRCCWLNCPAAACRARDRRCSGSPALPPALASTWCARVPHGTASYTLADFYLDRPVAGTAVCAAHRACPSASGCLARPSAAATSTAESALKFLWLARSDVFELRASARLLSGQLRAAFCSALGCWSRGGSSLPLQPLRQLAAGSRWSRSPAKSLGRYLFFVSVVPKNMAAAFCTGGGAA